ncbi:envelope-like protein [Cucumis melo var. makuwa]|uniref:Envelope-like protein n=1 Tax=Cucumis melo var. makuwa TaxID=1194695 RepID=A0A5A7T002_CUCMM|nr:envelope-like protein [Cucumis melo var. makuwa]
MVNNRKGTYTDKSTEEVLEAPSPRAAVHGIRTFPTNSDDLDDVPLARLLKKVAAPDVFPEKSADPVLSVHSQESSSSEDVFVPTPGLCQTSSIEPGPSHYSPLIHSDTDVLAFVLSRGTLSFWPTDGIPVIALSVKYAILHKIGIANWFPSSHASSVSVALGTFLYRISNDDRGSHVLDINHDVHPSLGPRLFDTTDWDEATDGFFVDRELASRILNSLTAESRSLSTAISLLYERRLEINSLIRHLKTFAPSSSRGDPSSN